MEQSVSQPELTSSPSSASGGEGQTLSWVLQSNVLPEASLRFSDTFWAYMAVSCWEIFRVNLLNLLENNRQRNIGFLDRSLG